MDNDTKNKKVFGDFFQYFAKIGKYEVAKKLLKVFKTKKPRKTGAF